MDRISSEIAKDINRDLDLLIGLGHKIPLISVYRKLTSKGLKESKHDVESIMKHKVDTEVERIVEEYCAKLTVVNELIGGCNERTRDNLHTLIDVLKIDARVTLKDIQDTPATVESKKARIFS